MLSITFIQRMKRMLGDEEYERYLASFSNPPTRALRTNPVKYPHSRPDALGEYLISELDFWNGGWTFSHDRIGTHPYHHAGAIYVQEPSAMVPLSSIDIDPGARVLDMCASPGGKSTQAAQKLSSGHLVSNEIVPARAKTLAGNIERTGFRNVTVTNTDTGTLARLFPSYFDVVIADAPCSGEGMFRKDEGAVAEWSLENVKMCASRQREILDNAALCTAPHGKIIYSTCTFSPEENEENVMWFLESHPEFTLISPSEASKKASTPSHLIPGCRRLYPQNGCGEGQFFAVFEKSADGERLDFSKKTALEKLPDGERREVISFLEKNLDSLPEGELYAFKENVVLIPTSLPVPEKITYSCGVTLGRVEKKVFRPHHQLFSALGGLFKNKLDFAPSSPELEKYLHGDTFSTSAPDGWACVTVDSVPLGGVKISGGTAKNHYPKGLRNN